MEAIDAFYMASPIKACKNSLKKARKNSLRNPSKHSPIALEGRTP
jgi:hypothetical protein